MNDLITTEQIEQIRAGKKPIGTGILRPSTNFYSLTLLLSPFFLSDVEVLGSCEF